jgi:hypothetical protein
MTTPPTSIRTETSYKALRSVVDVVSGLAMIPAFIGVAGFLIDVFQKHFSILSFLWLVVAIFLGVLAMALRQSLLLLVDIADSQFKVCKEATATAQLLRQLLRAYNIEPEA